MAKTFMQMAAEAQAAVPSVSPSEARRRMQEEPNTILIDVRDAEEIRPTGMIPGAIAVSAGSIWCPRCQRRDRSERFLSGVGRTRLALAG